MKIRNNLISIIKPLLTLIILIAGILRNLNGNPAFLILFVLVGLVILIVTIRRIFFNYLILEKDTIMITRDFWYTERFNINEVIKIEEYNYELKISIKGKKIKINIDRLSMISFRELESYLKKYNYQIIKN